MRDFFRSLRFKVFIGIALVLIGLMVRTAMNGGAATISADVLGAVIAPVQRASSQVTGFFSGLANDILTLRSTKEENAKLRKQIAALQSQLVDYNDIVQQDEQLQKALGLTRENPDLKVRPATVISRDPGQWSSTVLISKGSHDGIAAGDAVITQDNALVGMVTKVMYSSAEVTTLLDPAAAEGVVISETGDPGTARGDSTLLTSGRLRVSYLAKDSSAAPGDIIATSGQSGIYPKNVKVGTVEKVGTESSGMSVYAICRPIVDFQHLKDVFVVTDFSGKQTVAQQGGGK